MQLKEIDICGTVAEEEALVIWLQCCWRRVWTEGFIDAGLVLGLVDLSADILDLVQKRVSQYDDEKSAGCQPNQSTNAPRNLDVPSSRC